MKESSGKAVDDRVICYVQSVLDEIANDILKWTSMTINKFHSGKREISKAMLIAAIYTDRGLSELMEKLLPGADSDYCAIDIYQQTTATTVSERRAARQTLFDYDKICHKFEIDENSFLRDLSILVNVFKRRLEKGLGDDTAGRQYINSIFGNINDIYELTFRVLRAIEEVREMSQTQSMGAGLSEFAEGCEFDSYARFMEIFKEPIEEKVNALLKDKRYTAFFDEEDKISFTPDGQCMRMAFRYILPLYLHSVAAHFDDFYNYILALKNASKKNSPDYIELGNLETHLKSVTLEITKLEIPQISHKKYSRLRDDTQRAQHMSNIQRIQRSIENWEGKVIGFMCTEFIREGDLNVLHS
uniref:DH domain-containing protein n=1 Tax=Panagrolaimus sp. JU765 TaxID=591449 RepID=A0AC34RP55_9BILA